MSNFEREAADLDKAKSNLQGLVGPDETVLSVAKLQTGPTDKVLTLWAVLVPIVGALLLVLARRNYLVLATDRQTRVYKAGLFATNRPTKLAWTRPPRRARTPSFSPTLEHGGRTYRIASGSIATVSPDSEDPGAYELPASHDAVFKERRLLVRRRIGRGFVTLVALAGLVWLGLWWRAIPTDAVAVSVAADEKFCTGNNTSDYAAFDSAEGAVLVIGTGTRDMSRLDSVYRRPDSDFDRLVARRGSLQADYVMCVSGVRVAGTCTGDNVRIRAWSATVFEVSTGEQAGDAFGPMATVGTCASQTSSDFRITTMLCESLACPLE